MTEENAQELPFVATNAPVFNTVNLFGPGILEGRLPDDVYSVVSKKCLDPKTRESNGANVNINSIKEVALYPYTPEETLFENYMGRMFDEWVETFDITLPPIPLMSGIASAWVNYQKKGEFSPSHIHPESIHFIVVVKVPYGDEEVDPANYGKTFDSDMKNGSLEFVYNTPCDGMSNHTIPLTSDDEGKVFLFPGKMMHQIYPFASADGELITLCGNMTVVPVQKPEGQ